MFKRIFFGIVLLTLALLLTPAASIAQQVTEWDGNSRFTVLVLGVDRRPSEGDTLETRTDVVILISIDPATGSIGMLDIPRDTHIAPPGGNYARINTLFQDGELLQEGYGPYWVMDTVQYNLGIFIDRYVLFDFNAFITLIDAMGGVEITTTYPISDDTFPDLEFGYDPFYLPAGDHLLNGYDALRFVRTRHMDNDEVRGSRQLHMMQAVQEQLKDPALFGRLLAEAPVLLDVLQNDLMTDMTFNEMVRLAETALSLESDQIFTESMESEYTQLITIPGVGRRVRVPDTAQMVELMTEVFGPDYAG